MKAVIIKDKAGDVLFVAQVEEVSETEFIKLKKQAEKTQFEYNEAVSNTLESLGNSIIENRNDIKLLKGED